MKKPFLERSALLKAKLHRLFETEAKKRVPGEMPVHKKGSTLLSEKLVKVQVLETLHSLKYMGEKNKPIREAVWKAEREFTNSIYRMFYPPKGEHRKIVYGAALPLMEKRVKAISEILGKNAPAYFKQFEERVVNDVNEAENSYDLRHRAN